MATPTVGTVTTNAFTTGLMLDFEPLIALLDPFDTPILGGVGADGSTAISQGPGFEIEVDWQDETSLTPRTTLAATVAATDTVITVASGERARFQTDDVILIGAEQLRVTGYGTTADTLTVARAWAGATAAQNNASVVVGVGTAQAEGADPPAARSRDRDKRFNYQQVFGPWAITVSGSENAVRKYGLTGTEFDHQVGNRVKEAGIALEQAIVYGQRVIDTTNNRRTMGGFDYYITTNVDTVTTSLTESTLLTALQTCFDAGGSPDRVTTGSKQKRVISAFTSAGTVQVMRPDSQRGTKVDTFISDFGEVSVILDRWYRVSDLHIWNRDQAELVTLRNLHYEPLAKTGDAYKGMVIGEKSLRFRRQKHAYKFNALT